METALRFYGLAHDIDARSDSQLFICWLVCRPTFPADRPTDERGAYVFQSMRRFLRSFYRRRARDRERVHSGETEHYGHMQTPDYVLTRAREAEAAAREYEAYIAEYRKPGNFSKKQYQINRLKRDRLYGTTDRAKISAYNKPDATT